MVAKVHLDGENRRRLIVRGRDVAYWTPPGGLSLGTRLFTADMETGDLSQFTSFSDNGGASSRISTGGEPVFEGSYSMAQTSPGGGSGTRARIDGNILPGYTDPHENIPDEHWFIANYYIPVHVDTGNDDTWNIMQAKQTYDTGSGQSRAALWSVRPWERNGSEYGFQFKTRISQSDGSWASGNNFRPIQYDGPLNWVAQEWVEIAVHTLYSDTGNGFWRVYINGTLADEVTNAYTEVSAAVHDGNDFDISASWWKRQLTTNNYPSANHTPQEHTLFVDDVGVYEPEGA